MRYDLDVCASLGLLPCVVFLNGGRIDGCVAFDPVEGYVEFYEKDQDGQYIIEDNEIKRSIEYGTVGYEKHS